MADEKSQDSKETLVGEELLKLGSGGIKGRPKVVLPLVVGVASAGAMAVFGWSPALGAVALLGFAVAGLAYFMNRLGGSDTARLADFREAQLRQQALKREKMRPLKGIVYGGRAPEDVVSLSKRVLDQVDQVESHWQRYLVALGEKFDTRELTFKRYLGAAEDVYRAVLDGIDRHRLLLESLAAQQQDALAAKEKRCSELQALVSPSSVEKEELEALESERGFRREKLEALGAGLAETDRALLSFTRVTTAVNEISTTRSGAVDLEGAISQLNDLAERARQYSV